MELFLQALQQIVIPNRLPTVEFTRAPIAADPGTPYSYAYQVFWSGNEPDGRVDHFEYAIDPHDGDTAWVKTKRSAEVISIRAEGPGRMGVGFAGTIWPHHNSSSRGLRCRNRST